MVIWISGLPGSGKSTVADEIKRLHPDFIVLRMDEFRKIVTPVPTYSEEERDIVYRALVYLAKKLSEHGHKILIDATGNLRKWRELARQLIPGYVEVYLRCPLDSCILREQKRRETREAPSRIYQKGAEGWPVPGMGAPYEEPLNPEITIDTDKLSIEETIRIIEKTITKIGL